MFDYWIFVAVMSLIVGLVVGAYGVLAHHDAQVLVERHPGVEHFADEVRNSRLMVRVGFLLAVFFWAMPFVMPLAVVIGIVYGLCRLYRVGWPKTEKVEEA